MGIVFKASIIGLSLLALGFAAAIALPFESVKSALDLTAPDGDANQFTLETFASTRILLGIYAVACATLAIAISLAHERMAEKHPRTALTRSRSAWHSFAQHTTPLEWFMIASILAAGCVLRWMSLDLPMHSDESWTYLNYVSRNPIHILGQYDSPNNHVLHSLFAWLTTTLMGDTSIALRMPAFVAGMACMPLTYWLTFRQGNRHTALFAMALVAVWPMLVDYSANARGYSMITAGTIALIISADAIRKDGHTAAYVAFATISAFGLYTIPSFAISIITAGLWLVLAIALQRNQALFWQILTRLTSTAIGAIALTMVLYAPIVSINGIDAILSNDVVTGEHGGLMAMLARIADVWRDWYQGIPIILQALCVCGFCAAFLLRSHSLSTMWVSLFCAATIISIAQGTVGPSRIWMFALPLFLAFTALGAVLWWPTRWQPRIAQAASACLLTGFLTLYLAQPGHALYTEFGEFSQAESITDQLERELQPDDGLATMFPANRTINWYARRAQIIPRISAARERMRDNNFDRLIVVAPNGNTTQDTLAWNDSLNGSDLASRDHVVLESFNIKGATVDILRLN